MVSFATDILPSLIIVKEPEAVTQTCSEKKIFLEISAKIIDGRTIFSILINLSAWLYRTLWKEPQKLLATKIYSVGFNRDADFNADHDA